MKENHTVQKGAIESVSIGEIKLCLRHSLDGNSVGLVSRGPKLQLLICNLEVAMGPSSKSSEKKKTRKSSAHGSGKGKGKGKWKTISNIARYLSVCLTDFVLKTPKCTVKITELNVDISKDDGSESDMVVRVQILPIVVHLSEPHVGCDQLPNSSGGGCSASSQASVAATEKSSAPSICEKFYVLCAFGHDSVHYHSPLNSNWIGKDWEGESSAGDKFVLEDVCTGEEDGTAREEEE
ncbi:hypothetical protein RJT34_11953 [Clitoria ternatea]|uniref:Uncharacterized protein n=1 Tax=Clitoria ternatea TaxID=43366 RepID=A0AAN9JNJ2_CLITE